MAEASSSRVTVTLGRSGPVVKKAGLTMNESSVSYSQPSAGRKRSIRDRLGNTAEHDVPLNHKRQQRDGSGLSLSASHEDDVTLTKDDLRFKIMRKNSSQNSIQHKGVDLRDLLSRPSHSSATSLSTGQHFPQLRGTGDQFSEPRNGRPQIPVPKNRDRQQFPEHRDGMRNLSELRDSRQHLPETRDSRQHLPEMRDSRQNLPERRDSRQNPHELRDSRQNLHELMDRRRNLPEQRDSRQNLPELRDSRHVISELKHSGYPSSGQNGSSSYSQIRHSSSSNALPVVDSSRQTYSPWNLESLRRRSPDQVLGTFRDLSSPMRKEEQDKRPLSKAYDDSRATSYLSKDALDHSRSIKPSFYMAKAAQTVVPVHAKALLPPVPQPQLPPSAGLMQKRSAVDQYTVDGFLHSLGLEKYCINFKAEEVDMYALRQMGDSDLKDLGIPMGPRKKILLTLLSHYKRGNCPTR